MQPAERPRCCVHVQVAFQSGFVGDSPDMGNIMQLCGKTLGIIGMGANGQCLQAHML